MSDLFLTEFIGDGSPAPEPEEPTKRSELRKNRKERERRRKQKRRGRFFMGIIAVVIVSVVGVGALVVWPRLQQTASASDDYPGPGSGSVEVAIAKGDTGRVMGDKLQGAGVVKSSSAFISAFTANADAGGIQPGTYTLMLEMKSSDVVKALLDPKNLSSKGFTVDDGATVKKIMESAATIGGFPQSDLDAILADPSLIGLPAEAGGNIEGWLAPARYSFNEKEDTAVQLFSQMIAKRVSELSASGIPQADWQRMLIKASISEKEVRTSEDRQRVSQTIDNRLEIGMKLEMDSVVAYGAGKNAMTLTRDDFKNGDNPYNVYVHTGLPPGPIGSPMIAAVVDIANPMPGEWLYWCTVNLNTGETRFAETVEEHDINVKEYRAWKEANLPAN